MVDERIGVNSPEDWVREEEVTKDYRNATGSMMGDYNHWDDSQGRGSMHIGTDGTCDTDASNEALK